MLVRYILNGAIYHPEIGGKVFRKRGIPSGSFYTNMIDGIANLIMNYYSLLFVTNNLFDFTIFVCGDDNLILSKDRLDVNRHALCINSTFHVTVEYPSTHVFEPRSKCYGHFLGSF
jgi:hypothetical protein